MDRDPKALPASFRLAAAAVAVLFCAQAAGVALTQGASVSVVRSPAGGSVRAAAAPGGAQSNASTPSRPRSSENAPTARSHRRRVDLVAYEDLGSWIDLFNHGPWRDPVRTVRRMHKRGVRTIYLQTATYGSPAAIVYPKKVGAFIRQAHERDMKVVAWSVPSFAHEKKDFWRARAAIKYRTRTGDGFDSFGLDIEATHVRAIWKRNRRLMILAKKLRAVAGPRYPLGAITPDPAHNLYWPNFPYRRVARVFDVIVPMGYWTFQAQGYKRVKSYTAANIAVIRRETGDRKVPIHVIGGIADDVGVPGARGFVRAIKEKRVLGGSLYDFPITSRRTWSELSSLRSRRGPAR